MSRKKWVSATTGENDAGQGRLRPPTEAELEKFGEEELIVLLYGFNNFGDKIYNYIKLKFRDYYPMRENIRKGGKFEVPLYGEVIAAGKGEPTPEVRAEIEGEYKFVTLPN